MAQIASQKLYGNATHPDLMLQQIIQSRNSEFLSICQSHHVETLYAFGSSVTDRFHADSDIDLLITVDEEDPLERGEALLSIWDQLEAFFQRQVDLLTDSSIKNPILRKNIDQTKVLLYDGRGQEVFS